MIFGNIVFFTVRIVNLWNSLPENVVSANTVNTFKNRLDKFWSDQELVYDYKADLTGIGNRSLISLEWHFCIIIKCTYLFPYTWDYTYLEGRDYSYGYVWLKSQAVHMGLFIRTRMVIVTGYSYGSVYTTGGVTIRWANLTLTLTFPVGKPTTSYGATYRIWFRLPVPK